MESRVNLTDDNIVIHMVVQMYESNWFLEEAMNKWNHSPMTKNVNKVCKRYNDAKEQTNETMTKVMKKE